MFWETLKVQVCKVSALWILWMDLAVIKASQLNYLIVLHSKNYYQQVSSILSPKKSNSFKLYSLVNKRDEGLHFYNEDKNPGCWTEPPSRIRWDNTSLSSFSLEVTRQMLGHLVYIFESLLSPIMESKKNKQIWMWSLTLHQVEALQVRLLGSNPGFAPYQLCNLESAA